MAPVNITGLQGMSNLLEKSSGPSIIPVPSRETDAAVVDDRVSRSSEVEAEATLTRGMEFEALHGTNPDTSMWLRIHLKCRIHHPKFLINIFP